MRESDWSSDVCSSDLTSLRCTVSGISANARNSISGEAETEPAEDGGGEIERQGSAGGFGFPGEGAAGAFFLGCADEVPRTELVEQQVGQLYFAF